MAELFPLPSPAEMGPVSLERQIKCVERELALRQRTYPKSIAAGRMTVAHANIELHELLAVLETLRMYRGRLLQIERAEGGV